jgi:hypothetical protein
MDLFYKKIENLFLYFIEYKINQHALKMQEVSREDLVPGKEYYLQDFETGYEPPQKPSKMIAKFEKLEQSFWNPNFIWAYFTNLRNLEDRNDQSSFLRVQLSYNWKFYEILRDKIQKNMENRAYNMVLLHVIKDEYFKPINVI